MKRSSQALPVHAFNLSPRRNVSKRTGRGGFMPLHVACAVGNVEAVRMILGNSTAQIAATDLAVWFLSRSVTVGTNEAV